MGEKQTGSLDELYQLLDEFDTAMLVTLNSEHQLHARPMELQDRRQVSDCDLWFVTASDAAKVGQIAEDQQVNVCCFRARDKAFVSISARARISDDAGEIRRLYKPSWRIWMGGDATSSAVLLKLTIEHAEYWEPAGGRARILYAMAKAALTGKPAPANLPPTKEI